MQTVADYLERASLEIGTLENALRGTLENQNLADIIASARAKLLQASQHADAAIELGAIHREGDGEAAPQ